MTDTPDLWQLDLGQLTRQQAERTAARLEDSALTVTLFEDAKDARLWSVQALFDGEPARPWLIETLDLPGLDNREPGRWLARLQSKDWVTESLKELPAVSAGRFYVHGTHLPPHPSPAIIDLTIDAGLAFGSGQHETTRGCLLAIDLLAKRRHIARVLDLGTGSGVLALAAAKIWHGQVLAADIDPVATRVARDNARRHGEHRLGLVTAPGFAHRAIAAGAPYDLILANILARPLARLAPAMPAHLAAGGIVVLSGLLKTQDAQVRAAYRAQGLVLWRRIVLGDWLTLLLRRAGA